MNIEGVNTAKFEKEIVRLQEVIGESVMEWYDMRGGYRLVTPGEFDTLVFLQSVRYSMNNQRLHEIQFKTESPDENQERFERWAEFLEEIRLKIQKPTTRV